MEVRFTVVTLFYSSLIHLSSCHLHGNMDLSFLFGLHQRLPYKKTSEILRENGYHVESHEVITDDGYILQMFRVPFGPRSPRNESKIPVFLNHGIAMDSSCWLFNSVDKALVYKLSDHGYDVWLSNVRGTRYSLGHVDGRTRDDASYWDFSWHEMGVYDLPAMIDHVLRVTNMTSLKFIGFSQGCTTFLVMLTKRPEYNKKVSQMFALAPAVYLDHSKNLVTKLGFLTYHSQDAFVHVNKGRLIRKEYFQVMVDITGIDCSSGGMISLLCEYMIFLLLGFDRDQVNQTMYSFILSEFPSFSLSSKTLIHYGQLKVSKRFCEFDYGVIRNRRRYGRRLPPGYDLSRVKVPMKVFYGPNDNLADPKDVRRLVDTVQSVKRVHRVMWEDFMHLDFVTAQDADELVYNNIIDNLNYCTWC